MSIDRISGKPAFTVVQTPPKSPETVRNGLGKTASPDPQDVVNVSSKSREFQQVRQMVDSKPDFRLDRVHHLAKAIDAGVYNVKAEIVADAVIRKNLVDLKA